MKWINLELFTIIVNIYVRGRNLLIMRSSNSFLNLRFISLSKTYGISIFSFKEKRVNIMLGRVKWNEKK